MTNFSVEEFSSLLKQYFGFLVDEYGFELRKHSDLNYDFVTSATKISVFIEFDTLVVGIEPVGEETSKLLRNNILPEKTDVIVVARALHPDLNYKIIWNEPIQSAMERESGLLKDYCEEFLRGDFTKWTKVIDYRKKS